MLRFTANLSLLFNEVKLLKRFKLAKDHGFTAVEVQFPYSESTASLHAAMQKNQLKLVLFNVAADDLLQGGEGLAAVPEKRSQFRNAVFQAVEYAQILQPEAINILPGRCFDPNRTKQYLDTFIDNLCFALECFAPLGIKTVFEAVNTYDMPGFIIHSGKQMLDIMERIQSPDLFMQYDIYHMTMMADNPDDFILKNAAKIGHIQFADVPGRGQPGSGNIDFASLFAVIELADYHGWLGAEYQPTKTTANSLSWFRKTFTNG